MKSFASSAWQSLLRAALACLLGLLALIRVAAESSSEWVERDGVRMHVVRLEPMLTTMRTETLISYLRYETQTVELVPRPAENGAPALLGPRRKAPALAWGFAPVVESVDWWPTMRHPDHSPVVNELVRRGVDALPQLIQHLTDKRLTYLVEKNDYAMGSVGVADHYDSRYADRPPPGVNTVRDDGDESITQDRPYVYTVGDLCLRAILQIVNRQPQAGKSMGHVSVINSPTRYPQLAAAVQADWGGLTVAQHEASLRADANEWSATGSPSNRANGALQRLLFYYPAAGRAVAERCLGELIAAHARDPENRALPFASERLFLQLSSYDWPGYRTLAWEYFHAVLSQRSNSFPQSVICARLLAGHGHDEELAAYFRRLIDDNRRRAAAAETRGVDRDALLRYNECYETVVRDLGLKR